jgi:acetyltransferase-like isoleucine patch superfamily enzyme
VTSSRSTLSYLSDAELREGGIGSFGRGVRISRDARLYGADRISIGDNVRIDAFCVLAAGASGFVRLGSHIHLAVGVSLFGGGGIDAGDFCTISCRTTLYSASDDYSGEHLIGPQIDEEFLEVDEQPIVMEQYSAVGAHALILPGVTLGEGAVLGAASLAKHDLAPWSYAVGTPAKSAGRPRSQGLVVKAAQVRERWKTAAAG